MRQIVPYKFKAALLIETLISMVIISTIMLLFSFVIFNALSSEVRLSDRVNSSIWIDRTADSLYQVPVEQIASFSLVRANMTLDVDKSSFEGDVFLLNCRCFKNKKLVEELKLLRYE